MSHLTVVNKTRKQETITRTTEHGIFIRRKIRKGKKRKQKTITMTKNDKKVILGYIGDFELYVYPYDYPDKVFFGAFPISTCIEQSNLGQLFSAYNKARTYLNGEYFSKPNWRKGANSRRRAVQRAYNRGLESVKKRK